MKRGDLYRSRGRRPETPHRRSSSPKPEGSRLYPFCHFFQLAAAILALLFIAGSQYIFPEVTSQKLQQAVKTEIESPVSLTDQLLEGWNLLRAAQK